MSRQPTPVVVHVACTQPAAIDDSSTAEQESHDDALTHLLPPWSPMSVRTPSHHDRLSAPIMQVVVATPTAIAGDEQKLRKMQNQEGEGVGGDTTAVTLTRYISERHGYKLREEKERRERKKKEKSSSLSSKAGEQKAALYMPQTTFEVPQLMSPQDNKKHVPSRRSFEMSDEDFDDELTHHTRGSHASRGGASAYSEQSSHFTAGGPGWGSVHSGGSNNDYSPPAKREILGWAPVRKQLMRISDLDSQSTTTDGGSTVSSLVYQQADYKHVRHRGVEGKALQSFGGKNGPHAVEAGRSSLLHSSSYASLIMQDSTLSDLEKRQNNAVAYCFQAISTSIVPRGIAARQGALYTSSSSTDIPVVDTSISATTNDGDNDEEKDDDDDKSQSSGGTYRIKLEQSLSTVPPVIPPAHRPLEYQVHSRVPGWKLAASQQRRTQLVGLLDIVNSDSSGPGADINDTLDRVMSRASIHGGGLCPHLPLHEPSAKERVAVTKRQVQSYLHSIGRLAEARKFNPATRAAALKGISQQAATGAAPAVTSDPSRSIAALIAPSDRQGIRQTNAKYIDTLGE